MSTFNLTINIDNAAFDEEPALEVARILAVLADRIINSGYLNTNLLDINGNVVGKAGVEGD